MLYKSISIWLLGEVSQILHYLDGILFKALGLSIWVIENSLGTRRRTCICLEISTFPLKWISCFSRPRPRRHYNFAQSWSFLVSPEIFSFPCGFLPKGNLFRKKSENLILFLSPDLYFPQVSWKATVSSGAFYTLSSFPSHESHFPLAVPFF